MKPLRQYKNVKLMVALCQSVKAIQLDMQNAIMKDFDTSLSSGIFKHQAELLYDACGVLELMEFDAK